MDTDEGQMQQRDFQRPLADYWPLITLVAIALLASLAINLNTHGTIMEWMHYFMGLVFCQFAMLKIFSPSNFANGFQMYDLIAKQSRYYALCYPFIELSLGLAYLAALIPLLTYTLTVFLMSIGSVGVIQALKDGLNISCPCMGTALNVPLSTVTLLEDLGMGLFALCMLVLYFV